MSTYQRYIVVMVVFNLFIWATPFIATAQPELSQPLYGGFSLICHQLTARSLCLYDGGIGDCVPGNEELSLLRATQVTNENGIGHKFPVDARDMAIYAMMLVGGLVMPFLWDTNSRKHPSIFILIAAALPTLLDGGTQLFGIRESTNILRIITGAIMGFAVPFYLVPLANHFIRAFRKK